MSAGMTFSVFICLLSIIVTTGAQCGVTLTATDQTQPIVTPSWPANYSDHDDCWWQIIAPVDTGRIYLEVTVSDIACCCDGDVLRIHDGSNKEAQIIAKLCSDNNPRTITSSGTSLYGRWTTDGQGSGTGYGLSFSYFNVTSCPPGWLGWSEYCYKLYSDYQAWEGALDRCGYDAGFLTSIHSQEENDFISGSVNNDSVKQAWIGLSGGDDQWIDDASVDYKNFDESDKLSSNQCGTILLESGDEDNGKWIHEDCSLPITHFICKKRRDGTGGRYSSSEKTGGSRKGGSYYFGIFGPCSGCLASFFFCRKRGRRRNGNHRCGSQPRDVTPRQDRPTVQTISAPQPADRIDTPRSLSSASTSSSSSSSPRSSRDSIRSNPSTKDPPAFNMAFTYSRPVDDDEDLPPPPSYQESVAGTYFKR